ncbi:MAG TPA: sugar transferase [Candidatus Binatia bacterium]|nr:sugar transferase [Candidatus Binatia bacterium]
MKRTELSFNLVSILVDFLMIIIAGVAAFYLRFELAEVRPILFALSLADYLRNLLLVSPILLLLLAIAGLYNLKGTRRVSAELLKIVLAISSGLLVVVVLFFFNQTLFPSRIIILLTWLLAIVLVSSGRIILRMIQVNMLKNGIGLHKLVVINSPQNHRQHDLVEEITNRPELGYKIVDILEYKGDINQLLIDLEKSRVVNGIDEMLQADAYMPSEVNNKLLQFCRDYGILFNFVPDIFETSRTNVAVETISGIPVIVLKGTPLEGWGRVAKRVMDIALSGTGLIVASPIFLLTAIAIKLNSKGPVFFHQPRAAGLGSFECYKFRSMYYEMSEGTESGDKLREQLEKQNARQGPYVKIKNDPRVTSVGRFIRRTKIDELPQLWHILRGQMSLVGPRVHMVKEVDKFRDNYKSLFTIKPGATGLTQITQATEKPEISWEEEIKLDAFYIENWSIWLDLVIIFKTILILLGRKPKVDY